MAAPSKAVTDDISYLKQDMAKVGLLVDRLDVTIDKLTEVSTNISQLLAVHETKITSQEGLLKQTSDLMEKRRQETEDKLQLLHGRISSGEKELQEKIDQQYDDILEEIKAMRAESTTQHNTLSSRITVLEKLVWVAVGAAAILGALISHVDFSAIF
jgi:ABC-type siderophore export system fused ATPase/permease subunit